MNRPSDATPPVARGTGASGCVVAISGSDVTMTSLGRTQQLASGESRSTLKKCSSQPARSPSATILATQETWGYAATDTREEREP